MKKLRQLFVMLALCLSVMVISPVSTMTVHAEGESPSSESTDTGITDTGNAINDILKNGRFQGAISSISKITEFVDIWFVRIISVVSFFIISAALLKNACAGAYCANSKFWDKVADAHQKTEALNLAGAVNFIKGGQGIMNVTPGGIRDFFLGIVPNIKAFTDFEDADIEPKAYFMKAIPQMIACVIIGIFIYNGYYRDTASTVGEMGSVLIERTLGSVNPDSFVNKIFNTTGWPKSPWDKDKSREGKWKQAVFKELRSICASNYSDITSASQKADAVTGMVNMIQTQCGSDFQTYAASGGAGEGYVYEMSGISSYASTATSGMETGIFPDGTDNMRAMYMFDMSQVGPSTSRNPSNNTAYVQFTLKKVVDDGADGNSTVTTDGWGVTGGGGIQLKSEDGTAEASVSDTTLFPSGLNIEGGVAYFYNGCKIPLSRWVSGSTNGLRLDNFPDTTHIDDKGYVYFTGDVKLQILDDGRIQMGRLSRSGNKEMTPVLYLKLTQ